MVGLFFLGSLGLVTVSIMDIFVDERHGKEAAVFDVLMHHG
jgi:hypothetical protein